MTLSALHISGNQVQNEADAQVRLKSVNLVAFLGGGNGDWMQPSGTMIWDTWNTTVVGNNLDAIAALGANCVRVLATAQYWINNTGSFQSHFATFCDMADTRGLYVDLCFWRVSDSDWSPPAVPYPPYDTKIADATLIANYSAWASFLASIANTLQSKSNLMLEIWNEPYYTTWDTRNAEQTDFLETTVPACCTAIRVTGYTGLIVVQWEWGIRLDPNNINGDCTLDWIIDHHAAITDPDVL